MKTKNDYLKTEKQGRITKVENKLMVFYFSNGESREG